MSKYKMTVMIDVDVNLSNPTKQILAMAGAHLMGTVERRLQDLKAVCVPCERGKRNRVHSPLSKRNAG